MNYCSTIKETIDLYNNMDEYKKFYVKQKKLKKKMIQHMIPCTAHGDGNQNCGCFRLGVWVIGWEGIQGNFLYSYLRGSCLGVSCLLKFIQLCT